MIVSIGGCIGLVTILFETNESQDAPFEGPGVALAETLSINKE